jgi:hypothetical protein
MEDVTTRKGVIQKPSVVLDYNKNMGGVNTNDGQLQSYKLARECLKRYYQKMFHYLLDLVCLNAFIIHKKSERISRLDFLLTLAESLSSWGRVVEPSTRGSPIKITPTFSTPSTLLPRHGARDIKEEAYQEMCSLLGQWKESSDWCPDCEKAPCVVPRFQVYHKDINLKI